MMGQWFLQWGWAVALLVFAVSLTLMLYRSSVAAWNKAGGDWKTAALLEVGPFITFAAKVSIGAMVFMWATMYIYGAGQGSPVAQSFYKLGQAGVAAIGGSFQSYEVSIPEAPSLSEFVSSNLPTESDLKNALGVQGSSASPVESSASNEWKVPSVAPASSNLGSWNPSAIYNTNGNWGNPATMGPAPKPTQGPAPRPTATMPPIQGPAPADGWNINLGGGGGPLAADADAAAANVGTYTVKSGDSLISISVRVYGNRSGWARICNANRSAIRDCNNLRAGMVLNIP